MFRVLGIITLSIAVILALFIGYVYMNSEIPPPNVSRININPRKKIAEDHYIIGNSFIKKNKWGIWEVYIEGSPYERGLIYGELTKDLIQTQEDIFVEQINKLVPNKKWQFLIRILLGFFNSSMPKYIPLEFQEEIYGVSKSFSNKYNYIANKYTRILNYHGAHDIGHALNDYNLVGCTSFAITNKQSADSQLILGRNFDFYVGDDFAKNKIILFIKPDNGNPFVSYSWAGFMGVVSGLNTKGISITINASKSDVPTSTKEPISLLAREILQYSNCLADAIEIAKKRNIFVSETLMIGSAKENKAILIEKTPTKIGVYDTKKDVLVCSNHFQSASFKNNTTNINNIKESDSKYRFDRTSQLISNYKLCTAPIAMFILRDQHGLKGDTLGMGNPMAVNQLIAHHSTIIQPHLNLIYISTPPYQLGTFIGYDIKKSFEQKKPYITDTLPPSNFLTTEQFKLYEEFKLYKQKINDFIYFNKSINLNETEIERIIKTNAELYYTYELIGNYYLKKGDKNKANKYFRTAKTKKLDSYHTEMHLDQLIQQTNEK